MDGAYFYRILGDFERGKGYYVYEGLAMRGQPRRVVAAKDGELMVATDSKFDGSLVLARFMALHGAGQQEDGGYWMRVSGITTVDGKDMLVSGTGDLRGKSVLEAVTALADAAGPYANRLPYRFSYVYDASVPRGHVIDYFLEGDSGTGEIYRLDIVVSNGPEGQNDVPMVVPLQWEATIEMDKTYPMLRYFVLPGKSDGDERIPVYALLSFDEGQSWYKGEHEGEEMYETATLRGDGTSPDDFYPPEGYGRISWVAAQQDGQHGFTLGDPVWICLALGEPNDSGTYGEPLILPVPSN